MHIVITIDSTQELSPVDRTILTLLGDSTRYGREGFRPADQFLGHDGKPFVPATSVAHPGAPIDLSEGRAKEVPCLHYTDSSGVCKRCGEQVMPSDDQLAADIDTAEAEAAAEEKPKRKRRTKAEMEAARAAEAETAQEQGEAGASEPEQAENVQEDAPEPEAASEAPEAAEGDRTIDEWRKEAVAQATAAVGEGRRPAVKAALDAVGAKRVGELRDDQLAAFLGALKDA